jgi:hypothetical protein
MTDTTNLLRHIRVLESQVEGNREVAAALRELEENLIVRIDEASEELEARLGLLEQRVEERFDALDARLSQVIASIGGLPSAEETMVNALEEEQ